MAYLYYAQITIDNTKVPANQTNFPVLVSGTYDGTGGEPDIRTAANGGHVQNTANGGVSGAYTVPADLVFSPNDDGSAPYDFEVQEYDATTGKIIAWVRIPALSSTVDTVFYMVYGDAAVVVSQEDVAGTWNANYMAVLHLVEEGDGTPDEFKDSSGNANHANAGASPTSRIAGQIGYAQYFDGTGESIIIPHSATLDDGANGPFTLEMWCYPESIANYGYTLVKNTSAVGPHRYRTFAYNSGAAVTFGARNPATDAYIYALGYVWSAWYHVSYRQTGGFIYIRVNGSGDGSGAYAPEDSTEDATVGTSPGGFNYKGAIDELRISNVNRGFQYEQTCHNNTSDPASFYAMGDEEGGPPIPPPGTLPGYELSLMRSHPQMSDAYMVIQQPQRYTDAEYMADREWVDYDWSCRINGDVTGDAVYTLVVDTGGPAVTLLDGMTILIGSEYGAWDKAIAYVRGDQVVGPATIALNIAVSSEVRGHVLNNDYVVVLDEFRLRQRYGRIVSVGGVITWYKDWDIEWGDLGVNPQLSSMPPVPIMGPHAVKFVDPDVGDGHSSSFYFDWSDSYALALAETVDSWDSWGEINHTGGTWVSAAETPGWQTTEFISGLRGFRVVLEVDDGNGNDVTLPYRRGVRYVFTLRRPGHTQEYDPPNAEPLTHFKINSLAGSYTQGYWKASITVYEDQAYNYLIMPGALVVLFTDDHFMADDPYMSPRSLRNVSVGPIHDRENILMVGRIADNSIEINPETLDVTFEIESPGEEAYRQRDYPVVINDNAAAADWINTPSLTIDRAARYFITWHTTLSLVADVYRSEDTHSLYAQDFLEGSIYGTLDSFLRERMIGRLLCDKYGRFYCEQDANNQPYGSLETLWVLDDRDWLDILRVRQYNKSQVSAAECGGIIYTPAAGTIVPKLSRAPGIYDRYGKGTRVASNSLAIDSQVELNVMSGRYLNSLLHEFEVSLDLAGNWRYCDITPQEAVYLDGIDTNRGLLAGRYIIRDVNVVHNQEAGCIFVSINTEQEMDDGVPGVTIVIPDELPDLAPPEYGLPTTPAFPDGFADEWLGLAPGAPPAGAGYWYASYPNHAEDYWDEAHSPTWGPAGGLWDAVASDANIYKTCLMYSATTNRFFGYGWDGIWEYSPLPLDTGVWAQQWTAAQIGTLFGHPEVEDSWLYVSRMEFSSKASQEGWGWATGIFYYYDGDADEHMVLFCLHTRNGWDNIVYATVVLDVEENVDYNYWISWEPGLAIDMHSNTVYILEAHQPEEDLGIPTYNGWWRLYRSQDFGQTFALAQEETFVWGVDGYGLMNPDEEFCDVWAPWKSPTYQGGTVFWTTTILQSTSIAWDYLIIPKIYQSQNHALTRENIGDDGGDLTSGLSRLGGPYNSTDRVYGSVSMYNGANADQLKAYMWKEGSGWSLVRATTQAGGFWDSLCWVVMEQDGYVLERYLAYGQPYYVRLDGDVNVGPGLAPPGDINIYWLTYIPA